MIFGTYDGAGICVTDPAEVLSLAELGFGSRPRADAEEPGPNLPQPLLLLAEEAFFLLTETKSIEIFDHALV